MSGFMKYCVDISQIKLLFGIPPQSISMFCFLLLFLFIFLSRKTSSQCFAATGDYPGNFHRVNPADSLNFPEVVLNKAGVAPFVCKKNLLSLFAS